MAQRTLTEVEKVQIGGGMYHRFRVMPRLQKPPKKFGGPRTKDGVEVMSRKAPRKPRRGRSEEKDAD